MVVSRCWSAVGDLIVVHTPGALLWPSRLVEEWSSTYLSAYMFAHRPSGPATIQSQATCRW